MVIYMSDRESALELSFLMGQLLLENGAEISRVQETMERVARSYKVEKFNVYVLSNAIFANGTEEGVSHKTEIKFVKNSTIHFGRIAAVNQLSREIAEDKKTISEAFDSAEKIFDIPYTANWLQILACGVGSAGFCFIYGGTIFDSISALIIGFIVQIFLSITEKRKLSKFITNLVASSLVALCAILAVNIGLGQSLDKIIVGSIIRLVPGVSLTTSIRDFFNSDYLSGTIRLIDALIVGSCIAIGVGVIIKLYSILMGGALA